MAFDPLTAVFDLGSKLADKLLPDPTAKAAAIQKLAELRQSGDLATMVAQTDINKVEASNASLFVSGWRPFVGWVCGTGLAMQFVLSPLVVWISTIFGHKVLFPTLDMETLLTLLLGLLGLGTMRTVEKLNGVNTK